MNYKNIQALFFGFAICCALPMVAREKKESKKRESKQYKIEQKEEERLRKEEEKIRKNEAHKIAVEQKNKKRHKKEKITRQKQVKAIKEETSQVVKPSICGANPYTWAPQIFENKQGIMGKYWQGDGTEKYPTGKAFINEIEYIEVVEMPHDSKPKNHKKLTFLGELVQMKENEQGKMIPTIIDLYGKPKNNMQSYNGPDADVYTFQRERNFPFESDEEGN